MNEDTKEVAHVFSIMFVFLLRSERFFDVRSEESVYRVCMERNDRSSFGHIEIPHRLQYSLVGFFHVFGCQSSVSQCYFMDSRVIFQSEIADRVVEIPIVGIIAANILQSEKYVFDVEVFLRESE